MTVNRAGERWTSRGGAGKNAGGSRERAWRMATNSDRRGPATGTQRRVEKRRFPRRAKSIRFRFELAGEQHYAVTTFVSIAGAYMKASCVPRPGTLLTLYERFNADMIELALRGEVMWCQDEASLERPETGFGLRFIELATRADPGHLEDFLKALDPARPIGHIAFEERANGAHAVYRFPMIELERELYREEDSADLDDLVALDLEREIDRLDEVAPVGAPPAIGAAPAPEPEPSAPARAAPEPRTAEPGRPRARKRSVTGIFTALFSRGARLEDVTVDQVNEPTPTIAEATLVHDQRRPRILVSWPGGESVARIESLGRQSATLWTHDAAPERGEEVTLKPIGAPSDLSELLIRARIVTHDERKKSGVTWLSLAFSRVDEQGRNGRFQEYLRHVNGPGADER